MLQLEVSLNLSLEVARAASAQGKLVILDPGPVRPLPEEFYGCCTLMTPNETEAQALVGFPVTGLDTAVEAATELLDRGLSQVVIKLGPLGAYYASAQGGEYVPPFEVPAIDSVAAGDAFNGALAVSLAEGQELGQAVRIANAAGALAVTRSGAQDSMPWRKDVYELVRSRQSGN